ncbi:MAG: ATP-dependent zinc protease [Deltaproteobacteria bacterium]|nr:ATP-dependent zinc protease [Deltaproteobacteria bacterium]
MSLSLRTNAGDDGVVIHDTARALRVGGQTVLPGEARVVSLCLPGRPDAADAIPAWVVAGAHPGPRVTIIGAPRGFEVGSARVAAGLRTLLDPVAVHGGIVVVPVFRPGGRFAARGQPVRGRSAWSFPGELGGNLRAREAFALFSELAVGSSVLLFLSAAEPGLSAALTAYGDLDDPRVRRLCPHGSTTAIAHAKPFAGSLAAAAGAMGVAVLDLCGAGDADTDKATTSAVISLLAATGTLPTVGANPFVPVPPIVITQTTLVRAPVGGLIEQPAIPGAFVERGTLIGRIIPPLLGRAVELVAPHDGMVLQATIRAGVRMRAPLFVIGRVSRTTVARGQKKTKRLLPNDARSVNATAVPVGRAEVVGSAAGDRHPLHVGWVERVSLPSLGVERLRAKIDTGARTSALHVTRMTSVGTTDGPHRRPILELTLPAGSRRGAPPATVRVQVREYVQVKDTSGRTERRPVIETTLRLGKLERRIRVTLTNRGDMLFPLLIGRTALGPGVVVDPARRLLIHEHVHSQTGTGRPSGTRTRLATRRLLKKPPQGKPSAPLKPNVSES